MKKTQLIAFAVLGGMSGLVAAGEWQFAPGLTYISGISDLTDTYEEYEEADGYVEVDIEGVPLGLAFFSHYQFDSGVRLGYGVGPLFVMTGDLTHTELPLYVTTGYTFFPASSVSPYIFGGFAVHFVDGDYIEEDNFTGAIYGVGIEFARNKAVSYVVELAYDTTEVDVETYSYGSSYSYNYYTGNYNYYGSYSEYKEEIKTYAALLSFRLMF